jgi:gluconokinase
MIVLVMGVAGVGKTTIGEALARALGARFIDADDYHPPENVAKMKAGIPLDDADRWQWLHRLNEELKKQQRAVLACSALKESYRQRLARDLEGFRIVYLHGSAELIRERMKARRHRYMPPALLDSQLATLEPPTDAIAVDVAAPLEKSVATIVERLQSPTSPHFTGDHPMLRG